MPLSSRRRTHPLRPTLGITPKAPIFPPGKSLIESLPPELLIQIFVTSQNTDFVLVSKAIYYLLGCKPSDSLLVEFCRFEQEKLHTVDMLKNTCECLKLVKLRGCTLRAFALWADRFMDKTWLRAQEWAFSRGLTGVVHVKKSWLKEENVDLLTRLIDERLLRFSIPKRKKSKSHAKIKHAALLFLHCTVDVEWLLTLKRWYDPIRTRDSQRYIAAKFDADLFKVMGCRKGITYETIDRVFHGVQLRNNIALQTLFGSGSLPIIRYLLDHGLAPTAGQLRGLHGKKIYEAKEIGQEGVEKNV